MPPKKTARFIEPMLLLRTDALPKEASDWEYQLKLDGYRAIAFKTRGRVQLRSRNDNDFSIRYPAVVKGLAKLPDETVTDGEVIALDEDDRPSFSVLQNYGSSKAPMVYFVFDHDARRSRRHEPTVDGSPRTLETQGTSSVDRSRPLCSASIGHASGAGCVREGSGLRGPCGETPRQPLREWPANRCLAEDAN
jgi:hypothetical protein